MASATPALLKPRKTPRQTRATITVDAIFEAAIQVLVSEGPQRLTTTRVAARAGVSIGTLYQYFPHKQALFYALNDRYLQALADRIEASCLEQRGATVARMVEALVTTYWDAKTERPELTRALYRSVAELDNRALIERFATRVDAAAEAMLASAPDAAFADLETVNLTLLSTVFGTVRNVFERDLPLDQAIAVREQLVRMCRAYVEEIRSRPAAGGATGEVPTN